MKKGITTVLFMIAISIVFIAVLAFINEASSERIARNQEIERYKSILYAFDIFPDGIHETQLSPVSATADIPGPQAQAVLDSYAANIQTIHLPIPAQILPYLENSLLSLQDSVQVYTRVDSAGLATSYGIFLRGKGLWGSIGAFGVISADLQQMQGIDFIEQVETPGLGARITESQFKYFFRGLDVSGFIGSAAGTPAIKVVGQKEQSNVEHSENTFQAITGATQTCSGVAAMVNADMPFLIELLKANESLLIQKGLKVPAVLGIQKIINE